MLRDIVEHANKSMLHEKPVKFFEQWDYMVKLPPLGYNPGWIILDYRDIFLLFQLNIDWNFTCAQFRNVRSKKAYKIEYHTLVCLVDHHWKDRMITNDISDTLLNSSRVVMIRNLVLSSFNFKELSFMHVCLPNKPLSEICHHVKMSRQMFKCRIELRVISLPVACYPMSLDNFIKRVPGLSHEKERLTIDLSREKVDPICTDWIRPFRYNKKNQRISPSATTCFKCSYRFCMVNCAKCPTEIEVILFPYCVTASKLIAILHIDHFPGGWLI